MCSMLFSTVDAVWFRQMYVCVCMCVRVCVAALTLVAMTMRHGVIHCLPGNRVPANYRCRGDRAPDVTVGKGQES